MKRVTILYILFGILILSSCNGSFKKKVENNPPVKTEKITTIKKTESNDPKKTESNIFSNRNFPNVINLKSLAGTDFVLTLEHKLTESKNSIYASSFLFAWEALRKIIGTPIIVDSLNSNDLRLLNQSNSFKGVLKTNEYSTEATLEDGKIFIKAYFKKSLPFAAKFHTIDEGIKFGNKKVKAFGCIKPDPKITACIQILYYKDDNHFVIKLLPKNENHEIILVKGINLSGSFSNLISKTNQLIYKGKKEMEDPKNKWKFEMQEQDLLAIPVIKFNIETNYKAIEKQVFNSDSASFVIYSAYQRTEFILDEYGSEVESNAFYSLSDQIPDSRKLYFDTPFLVYLKRTNSKNPYFAMKVMNAELMINN